MTSIQTCSKYIRMAAPAILLVTLGACRMMGSSMSDTPGTYGGSSSAAGSSTQAGGVSETDQKLMAEITYANIAEIKTGELALGKSQNPQVRAFAQKMIDDHTNASRELQRLADSKNIQLPNDTDLKHKAIATELGLLSGDFFDRRYMAQVGVADHRRTHELLEQTIQSATDPQLKALARKTLPVVDGHLDMAQRASGKQ